MRYPAVLSGRFSAFKPFTPFGPVYSANSLKSRSRIILAKVNVEGFKSLRRSQKAEQNGQLALHR